MNDATTAAAICTQMLAVTPPTGQESVKVATYLLDIPTSFPAFLLYPPEETIEYLPARQRMSTLSYEFDLFLDAGLDLPDRMAAVYAWRSAIRDQLAPKIQLGVSGVDHAYVTSLGAPELNVDDRLVDGLHGVITVVVREALSTLSAG